GGLFAPRARRAGRRGLAGHGAGEQPPDEAVAVRALELEEALDRTPRSRRGCGALSARPLGGRSPRLLPPLAGSGVGQGVGSGFDADTTMNVLSIQHLS